jgi:hypothetical protein
MEVHFELLEEKNLLISVDLEPQILSYDFSIDHIHRYREIHIKQYIQYLQIQ